MTARSAKAGTATGLVLTSPRTFDRRQFDLPDVGADDGVLRVEACGLCGTDHEQYTGHVPNRHAFIPGHEVVGVIESLGDEAADRWGVAAGQRVAVEVFQSCRDCDSCRAGLYRRCERNGLATMIGFTDADTPPGLGGGYATHLHLGPDSMLLPVPDELDPVTATLFNPLGAGIRWAVEVPETQPGDVVAILGPGVRGLCAAAAAKEAGAGFVMITGLGPRDEQRLALAPAFGVDLAVDVAETDPSQALRQAIGRKADVVVDVTAKAPAALGQAVQLARPGGTVVVAGVRGSSETPGFNPDHIVYKE
ncbi:MAG: zinc-dependent alcohol dehydrogenase, partial [Acidimicrobiales bacterium]